MLVSRLGAIAGLQARTQVRKNTPQRPNNGTIRRLLHRKAKSERRPRDRPNGIVLLPKVPSLVIPFNVVEEPPACINRLLCHTPIMMSQSSPTVHDFVAHVPRLIKHVEQTGRKFTSGELLPLSQSPRRIVLAGIQLRGNGRSIKESLQLGLKDELD